MEKNNTSEELKDCFRENNTICENYFLNVQLLEGPQKKRIFGINTMTPPTIDIIAIGLVSESGRSYYAVSNEFNFREAWDRFVIKSKVDNKAEEILTEKPAETKVYTLRNTILRKIFDNFSGDIGLDFSYENTKNVIDTFGISKKQMAEQVTDFCRPKSQKARLVGVGVIEPVDFPVFYSLNVSFPWVAFCWLFEGQEKLPKGFSTYCLELAQMTGKRSESFKKRIVSDQHREDMYSAKENAEYFSELYSLIK